MNVFSDTRTVKSMGICSGGVRNVRLFCVRPRRPRSDIWLDTRACVFCPSFVYGS